MRWPRLLRPAGGPAAESLPRVAPEDATEGRLIYSVGDIHGRLDLMDDLLARIRADARDAGEPRPSALVFLGDYVDRGPDSRGVLQRLVDLEADDDFEIVALRGNHEAAMLGFLGDAEAGPTWAAWGGDATLRSYGVDAPPPNAPGLAWADAQGAFAAALPGDHLALLKGLPLTLWVGAYLFVHAGVRPGVPLDRQDPEDLLMIRQPFLDHPTPLGRVVVHGHTPEAEPYVSPVRIGLDTGAFATGVLTAARLRDGDVRVLQARAGGDGSAAQT